MNKTDRIIYLLQADRLNKLTIDEREELNEWLMEPKNQALYQKIDTKAKSSSILEELLSYDTEDNFKKVLKEIEQNEPTKKYPYFKPILSYAASIALLVSLSFYFFNKKSKSDPSLEVEVIKPGGNYATLTLENGSTIELDTAHGIISDLYGIEISKDESGMVVYTVNNRESETPHSTHKISTPRGGQYTIILPDSSKVWLNSESSIEYPLHFASSREVKLSGEAYFDVTKRYAEDNSRLPFKIELANQSIEVLGTQLNVNAYNDNEIIKTTLLTGQVKVNSNNESVLLKPGEQAVLQKSNSNLSVKQVNTKEHCDWKEGYFYFENETIHQIMDKVSRWYDIEVEYKGPITDEGFGGEISRFENIQELLNVLEMTGKIKFQIEGRRVIVTS